MRSGEAGGKVDAGHRPTRHVSPDFRGTIKPTVEESTPWWPPVPWSQGRPNVVMVVLDDVGFSQIGCYGGSIPTPSLDALAARGLRYSNFHVTALCSPTRASLLTGRNNHRVGMGFLADFDSGFPGYRGEISPHAATVAEVLQRAGYGTYAVGKWHLVPPQGLTASGPFGAWPTRRGFDRYYGFLGGEEDQYAPQLWEDQHRVDPPNDDGYHLSSDLVDRAQVYLNDHLTAQPERPFFLYLAPGVGHAPHQVPRDYIERHTGRYDHGWDEERNQILERQLASGLVPTGTSLARRNPDVVPWASLEAGQRSLYARMQEVYAGFMEHADEQVGRLVAYLSARGVLDNTLLVVLSDNGASGEGGPHGTINEYRYFLQLPDSWEDALARIADLGGPFAHNHYPAGWAQAGNTPLKFYKKHTYGGGIRAPLIVHWPDRIGRPGDIRRQFHHVVDVMPTLAEAAEAGTPDIHLGVDQVPVDGVSMSYTWDEARAPGRRTEQYFETAGHRGMYRDGYKAVTLHESGTPYEDDYWSLYHLESDFSETEDLASAHPELVDELVERWWETAEANGVLPLDDRMQSRAETLDPAAERLHYVLLPGTRLMNPVVGPNFSGRGFRVQAELDRSGGEEGVILAYGRRAAGFSLFVQGGRLVFDFNLAGDHYSIESAQSIPQAVTVIGLRVAPHDDAAVAVLEIDDSDVGRLPLPMLFPAGLGTMSTQCGHNAPSPVSDRYESPFEFGGDLQQVLVDLDAERRSTANADWTLAMGLE